MVYITACTAQPFSWDEKHFKVSLELPQKLLQEASVVYTCLVCNGEFHYFVVCVLVQTLFLSSWTSMYFMHTSSGSSSLVFSERNLVCMDKHILHSKPKRQNLG